MLMIPGPERLELSISRRELFRWTAAGALGGLAAGLMDRPGPALAAGELDFLFPGGTWKEYFERIYATPFAKAKGIQVVFSVGDVAQQMSRVIAERQNERFDLLHLHQYLAAQLADLDLIVPPDPRIVTNLNDVDPAFRFPTFVGKVLAPFGLTYNVKKSAKKVASWKDLWDPTFAGRVAIPKWDWVGNTWFYAVNRAWGGTEENVDPGMAKCRDLVKKSRAIIMSNVEHGLNLFQTEEILVAPYYTARTEQAKQAGAPVEFVFPEEGGLNWAFNVVIIKGRSAAQTALAQEFLNMTIDPVKNAQFGILTGYPPTNRKAMALLPKNSNVLLTPAQMANLGKLQFDVKTMLLKRDNHAERWNKEVLGA